MTKSLRWPMLLPHYGVTALGRIVTLGGRELPLPEADAKLARLCNGLTAPADLAAQAPAGTAIMAALSRLEDLGVIVCLPAESPAGDAQVGHVIVSPHIDDAALSLGGMIAGLSAAGAGVSVLNVFSQQTYQTGLRVPADKLAQIAREEDRLAGRVLGYRSTFLGLDGAQDRHGLTLRQTIGQARHVAAPDGRFGADLALVKARVVQALAKGGWEASHLSLYAPLGLGGHVDHLLVHRAIAELSRDGQLPVRALNWYEDLPYAAAAMRVGADQATSIRPLVLDGAKDPREKRIDIEGYVATKRLALKVFRTRIRDMDIELTIQYAQDTSGTGQAIERIFL